MGPIKKQGDYVSIEFHSTDASTAAAITIKDANQATRTLQSNERLLLDSLEGTAVLAASDASTDITVTLFASSDTTVDAGERIWVFAGVAVWDGGIEGYSIPAGLTPKVKASGSGLVDINGVGRIIYDGTKGGTDVRPSWRESLVPGK